MAVTVSPEALSWASTPRRRAEARLPVFLADPHLHAVERVEHRPLGPAHVDLRDAVQQALARAQEQPQQAEPGGRAAAGRVGRQIVRAEAADDGRAEGDGARLGPEVDALLVDPVQAAGVDERERPPLLDRDRHAVRQATGSPRRGGRAGSASRRATTSRVSSVKILLPGSMAAAVSISSRLSRLCPLTSTDETAKRGDFRSQPARSARHAERDQRERDEADAPGARWRAPPRDAPPQPRSVDALAADQPAA